MTATDDTLPDHLRPPRRDRTPIIVGGVVVALVVVAVLAFGVFGVHTAFFDDEVDEAGPAFDSGARVEQPAAERAAEAGTEATEAPPSGEGGAEATVAATGTFEARDHPGEGTVNLYTDGNQTFVRFEADFSTDNGPDLYAAVLVAGERVELGTLKGNKGAQNYELPPDIDPAAVERVEVWCKRFDSTFTVAEVS